MASPSLGLWHFGDRRDFVRMKNEAMVLKLEQASLHAYRMMWNLVTGILAT